MHLVTKHHPGVGAAIVPAFMCTSCAVKPASEEERESILRGAGAGWNQDIVVQAEDNKLYKGKLIIPYGSRQNVTVVGDKGIATVFRSTDKLYCFHKNGIKPWHKHPAEPGKINKKAWLKVGSVSRG